MYIRSTGNISPQNTFDLTSFLGEPVQHTGNRLSCVEPDYKDIIDVKLIRRMSRIIKMGVAAAAQCLQQASIKIPDAITTGTAYGCLEDTGVFLSKMVEFKEQLLTPTAFIQSTHNTIGAQIALMLQCHNYNNAFVHRGFSFESALLDGIMLLKEGEANNVLIGGIDEITDTSYSILSRFGLYKSHLDSNLNLFSSPISKGTIAGEGAAFFLLTNEHSRDDCAKLDGITTFYKPKDIQETKQHISSFLSAQSININDIDLLVTGRSGDAKGDKIYTELGDSLFNNIMCVNYKNLCGEYPTSTAFALWLAVNIIKTGTIPAVIGSVNNNKLKRILIYNHYQGIHHSLLLVSAC